MLFTLLTRVLLWMLVGILVYASLTQWLSEKWRATLGTGLILFVMVGSFYNPNYWCVPYLWQIFAFFLKPLGLAMTLIYVGLKQLEQPGKTFITAGLVILLVASNPFLTYKLVQRVESEWIILDRVRKNIVPTTPQTVPKKEAAIVLMGKGTTRAEIPPGPRLQFTESGDRITYAAELYHQHRGNNPPLLIVCGGPREYLANKEVGYFEAYTVGNFLERLGVPRYDIEWETEGVDIRTTAVAVYEILKKYRMEDEPIILVTSALRVRRTALTFMKVGIHVISRPTDFYSFESSYLFEKSPEPKIVPLVADFIPSAQALSITTKVVEELLALCYYFLRGWLTPIVL